MASRTIMSQSFLRIMHWLLVFELLPNMVCCKSIVLQQSLLPLDDHPHLFDLILLGEVSVQSNVPGGLRRDIFEVEFATILPDQNPIRNRHLWWINRVYSTLKNQRGGKYRQGNIADREGRERGWSGRHHLNNGRPLLTLPVMSRFLNGSLTKAKTTLLSGRISSWPCRRKFGSVAAID